jgi:hypothetical protein
MAQSPGIYIEKRQSIRTNSHSTHSAAKSSTRNPRMDSTKNSDTATQTKNYLSSSTDVDRDPNTQLTPFVPSEVAPEQRCQCLQFDGNKTYENGYICESPTDYNDSPTSFETVYTPIEHRTDYYLPYYEIEAPQYDSHFTLEEHLIVNNDDPSRYSESTTITAFMPGTAACFSELSPMAKDWRDQVSREERIRLGIPVFQQASLELSNRNDRQDVVAEHMENAKSVSPGYQPDP